MTSDVLSRKLARIADKLQALEQVAPKSFEAFSADRSRRDLSAFYLALAIEDCIDIAEHLVSAKGLGAPDSYADAFRLLASGGVISADLAGRMVQAAGMRNAILHQYDGLDWARVYAAVSDLSRLREYIAAVA